MASDPQAAPPTAENIADQFEHLASVSQLFERELTGIAESRVPLSESTVGRLAALVEVMGPAARIRAGLARLPPPLLMAGVQVWVARQELPAWTPATTQSAAQRAQLLWTTRW